VSKRENIVSNRKFPSWTSHAFAEGAKRVEIRLSRSYERAKGFPGGKCEKSETMK
jgi:hypothetical protein